MSKQNQIAAAIAAYGMRPVVSIGALLGPVQRAVFTWTGTLPDNATTDAIDLRSNAARIGWHPTDEDNPDYSLIIDRVLVLADPVAAEQSTITRLLQASALKWSPQKDSQVTFNTGHASGMAIGDTGTTVAATTTRASWLRALDDFAPLDLRGSVAVNLRNQNLVFGPVTAVNVGAAVPVTMAISGAYVRNEDFGDYTGIDPADCLCNEMASDRGFADKVRAGRILVTR